MLFNTQKINKNENFGPKYIKSVRSFMCTKTCIRIMNAFKSNILNKGYLIKYLFYFSSLPLMFLAERFKQIL